MKITEFSSMGEAMISLKRAEKILGKKQCKDLSIDEILTLAASKFPEYIIKGYGLSCVYLMRPSKYYS